jgi:hypothetical protein
MMKKVVVAVAVKLAKRNSNHAKKINHLKIVKNLRKKSRKMINN